MKFFDNNPRKITKKQFEQLSADLEEFGDLGGIVHDLNSDQVISGNQRCRALDLSRLQPIVTERFEPPTRAGTVAIGYVEWRGERFSYRAVRWTPEQCLAANIKANLDGGSWDWNILGNWDADLLKGVGFDGDMLKDWQEQSIALGEMLAAEEGGDEGKDTEPQISKADELQQVWQVQLGDLWQCGEHRIICGDCTDRAVVERVMGGEKADLVFTDPPYNVAYSGRGQSTQVEIENDNMDEGKFYEWLLSACKMYDNFSMPGCSFYLCHGDTNRKSIPFIEVFTALNWVRSATIIWAKNAASMGWQDYRSQHECISYGWKNGAKHYFTDDRSQTTLWEISRDAQADYQHLTQKPVELPTRAIKNSSKNGDIVADFFLGSGTTLIACQNLNRRCRGIEISPAYCSVVLQRFLDHTKIQPILLSE